MRAEFSPSDVRLIRAQYARNQLDVRAWADARQCSIETVRRVARRDTYRHIPDLAEGPSASEPLPQEALDALAQLGRTAKEQPPQAPEVNALLDELRAKGEPR